MRSDGDVAVVQEARGTALRALTQPGPKAETRQLHGLSNATAIPRRETLRSEDTHGPARGYVSLLGSSPSRSTGDGEKYGLGVSKKHYSLEVPGMECRWLVVGGVS